MHGLQIAELASMTNNDIACDILYKVLQDKTVCTNFMEYLSIKQELGHLSANNLQFWLEVQRYKVQSYCVYC